MSVYQLAGYFRWLPPFLVERASNWTKAEAISTVAMAAFTLFALVFAALAWVQTKRSQWREVINSYFKEYRTLEMGMAVANVHHYRNKYSNLTTMVFEYVDEFQRHTLFHMDDRRRVSAFYQELAILCKKSCFFRSIIYSIWTRDDLKIIPEVLLPIETISIPLAGRKKNLSQESKTEWVKARIRDNQIVFRKSWAPVMKDIYKLWERAPKIKADD